MITENNTVMKTNISFPRIVLCLAIPLLFSLSCWNEFDDAMERVPSSKERLLSDIQTTETLHDNAVESNTVGSYAPGAKAALQTAIDSANAVYNDPASTTDDYRNAQAALDSAVTAFNLRRIKNLDVVFVVDTTGVMNPTFIVQTEVAIASTITDLQTNNSDTKFALVELNDFTSWTSGAPGSLTNGYLLHNNLTTNSAIILTSVNALTALMGSGWDPDEAHIAAMYGTAHDVSWTAGSDRIVILFTASAAHNIPTPTLTYPGPSWDEANAAIIATNIKPVGVYFIGGAADQNDLNSFFLPLGGQVYPFGSFSGNLDTIMNDYTTWWY